jgi:hypothetical protein
MRTRAGNGPGCLTASRWRFRCNPQLRAVLDATPSEHLTFLVTATEVV